MTGTTPTQNLVYPTGGDSIQAAGDAVKDLAFRTDARLDAQDYNLSVAQYPLLSVIESKVSVNFPRGFQPWTFDTVLVDIAGGVDLSNDPRRINLTRAGWWICGGYAECGTPVGAVTVGLSFNINVNNPSGITFEDTQDFQADGSHGTFGNASTLLRVDDTLNAYCFMSATYPGVYNSSDLGTMPVGYRRMWAYWMGDL